MCAIFGFIAKGDSGPSLARLRQIIKRNAQTVTRNRDAYGIAWVDANQRMGCHKRQGDFSENLDALEMVRDARVLIGHLRKTTVGTERDNQNNHPHVFDGGWIIHNGTILNHANLVTEWGLFPSTQCDTEILGLIANKVNRPRINQIETAVNQVDRSAQMSCMVIDHRPARLWIARRGKPLIYFPSGEGLYFCSFGGREVCNRDGGFVDNQVVEYIWKRNQGGKRTRSIALKSHRPTTWMDFRAAGCGRPLLSAAETSVADIGKAYSLRELRKDAGPWRESLAEQYVRRGRFHFDEQDVLVSDEEPPNILTDEGSILTCPKCRSIVREYADGRYCNCSIHEMDESLFTYEADDDPCKWDGVELMDPDDLAQMESR